MNTTVFYKDWDGQVKSWRAPEDCTLFKMPPPHASTNRLSTLLLHVPQLMQITGKVVATRLLTEE